MPCRSQTPYQQLVQVRDVEEDLKKVVSDLMAWHGMTGDVPGVEDLVDHPDEERRPGAHAALIAVPENVEQVSDVTMVVPKPLQQQDAAADFTDNAQDAWKKCKALEDACVDLLRHDLCLEAVRNLRQLRAHFYKRAKRDSTWRSMEELWCEQSKGSLEWKLRALRGTYLSREGRTEMGMKQTETFAIKGG